MARNHGCLQDVIPPAILFTRPHLHKVEQDPYESENLQKDWTPLPPIEFKVNGVEGMSLTDAMNRHFDGLDGRDDPMFTDESIRNSVSCRIDVRGFCDNIFCHRSTPSFDQLVRYPVDTKPRQVPLIDFSVRLRSMPLTDCDDQSQEGASPNRQGEIGP